MAKTENSKVSSVKKTEMKQKTEKKDGKSAKAVSVSTEPKKTVKATKKELLVSSVATRKHGDVQVSVFSVDGASSDTLALPESVFAAKVNKPLMAQAIRVYLANQREGSAATKTRSEVDGSTRKIYKQKGTGRARHGSIRAPIFVKGGVALGPQPRDYRLDLPKKMKKKAVASALTSQLMKDGIKVVSDMKNLELKTKAFDELFESLSATRKTLVLLGKDERQMMRAMRNLSYVDIMTAVDVHTYAVLHHRHLVLTKDAIKELETLYKEN